MDIGFTPDPDFELRLLTNDPDDGIIADVEEVVHEDPPTILVYHTQVHLFSVYIDGECVAYCVEDDVAQAIIDEVKNGEGSEGTG